MKYELKGRLLDIAQNNVQKYKAWHIEVLGKLQEIEPQTIGYILSSSVWTGGRVCGIVTSPDLVLKKWRAGEKPGWWKPNRRFKSGKVAAKVIGELPEEPDLAADIMAEIGFKSRCIAVGPCRYSAPGFTCLPKIGKAFIHWAPEFPPVNNPDMVEVLESYYWEIVEGTKEMEMKP